MGRGGEGEERKKGWGEGGRVMRGKRGGKRRVKRRRRGEERGGRVKRGRRGGERGGG